MADKANNNSVQQEIEDAQAAVASVDDEIAGLRDKIGDLKGEIHTLEAQIDELVAKKDEDEAFLRIVQMRAEGKSLRGLIALPQKKTGSRKPSEGNSTPRGPRVGNGVRSDPEAIREAVRGYLAKDEALTPAAIIERLSVDGVVLTGSDDKGRNRNLGNALVDRHPNKDTKAEFKRDDGRFVLA